MKTTKPAIIFFLPLSGRPANLPPLTKLKGQFWHTGIIFHRQVYECFDRGKSKISDRAERLNHPEFTNATYLKTNIIPEKIPIEIASGTDCAEFVARCTGLSEKTGPDKGQLWPEDIYNLLNKNL